MLKENKRNLTTPLHFARFEFKYVLPKRRRDDVEAHLQYFLELDPFVRDREDHKYSVRSLYYDTAVYSAFHDKIDGLHSRRKFRVRTYNEDAGGAAPYFLEIKGRHNNLVFKHRTQVPAGPWIDERGNGLSDALIRNADPSGVLDQFSYEYYQRHIRPIALIDYKRRPYISKYDSSFRITFDEQLTCFKAGKLFPEDVAQLKHIVPGHTVMEVKFHHHLPSWFHRVIQAHELRRVSISKICSGMEVLGMAYDED